MLWQDLLYCMVAAALSASSAILMGWAPSTIRLSMYLLLVGYIGLFLATLSLRCGSASILLDISPHGGNLLVGVGFIIGGGYQWCCLVLVLSLVVRDRLVIGSSGFAISVTVGEGMLSLCNNKQKV